MRVRLYALQRNGSWTWHLTLDARVDARFWRERLNADFGGMGVLEPSVHFGQAVEIIRQLSGAASLEGTMAHVKRLAPGAEWRLAAIGDGEGIEGNGRDNAAGKSLWSEDPAFYREFVASLSGRQLLFEEVLALGQHIASKMSGGERSVQRAGHIGTSLADAVTPGMMRAYIQLGLLRGDVGLAGGMQKLMQRKRFGWGQQLVYTCRRCGSGMGNMRVTHCASCGDMCPYCEGCLTMGRVRSCSILVRGVAAGAVVSGGARANGSDDHLQQWIEPWGLSPAQTEAAREGLRWMEWTMNGDGVGLPESKAKDKSFLIWAVTGAGKTEMIFPFIGYTLARGGKVLIATPRRDVVLELRPRILRAFPGAAAVTLYGGSEERWDAGPIVIATTHQLMRFHEAFDLVIVDELDAFPYHGDPLLQFAARNACKPSGCTLLLSATPPPELRRAAVRGKLPHVKVPARYHGCALPVPRQLAMPPLPRLLQAGRMPPALAAALAASLARGAQLFVFVPSISSVEPAVQWLRDSPIHAKTSQRRIVIEGTSSQDSERIERVQRFRDGEIRVLVTTTILERGITVPKTDVFILGADSRLFDEAALVQMSGRAGRSKDDPAGNVYFAAAERTKAQSAAIAHIKNMNKLARRKGFLKE